MDIAPWISAGAAVVSILGSAFAYYQANLSKKARAEAAAERERAQRAEDRAIEAAATAENHLKAAQQQVHVLEQHLPAIATAVEKSGTDLQDSLATRATSQLRIEWIAGSQYTIVNPTATALRIENILNKDEFVNLVLKAPFEVSPSSQKTFLALGAWQQPLPDNLIFDEVGCDETALPSDSSKTLKSEAPRMCPMHPPSRLLHPPSHSMHPPGALYQNERLSNKVLPGLIPGSFCFADLRL